MSKCFVEWQTDNFTSRILCVLHVCEYIYHSLYLWSSEYSLQGLVLFNNLIFSTVLLLSTFLNLHYILVVRDLVNMPLFCTHLMINESGHFPWCFSWAMMIIAFVRLLSNSRVANLLFPVRLKDDFILTFLHWLNDTLNKLLLSCSSLLINIFHWDGHIY